MAKKIKVTVRDKFGAPVTYHFTSTRHVSKFCDNPHWDLRWAETGELTTRTVFDALETARDHARWTAEDAQRQYDKGR